MKYLNGEYYVEVKHHRYKTYPTENFILRKRDPPQSLRTQYQVQSEIQMRKNQKVIRDGNNELLVKKYPKSKQTISQQPKFKPPKCLSCTRNTWLQFDKGYYCTNCEYIINKQKHQIDKIVRRQDHYFSTRLSISSEKLRETSYSVVYTTHISSEDIFSNLQSLKGKTKLKVHKN